MENRLTLIISMVAMLVMTGCQIPKQHAKINYKSYEIHNDMSLVEITELFGSPDEIAVEWLDSGKPGVNIWRYECRYFVFQYSRLVRIDDTCGYKTGK